MEQEVKLQSIKKGDEFYETAFGYAVKCVALEDAYVKGSGYACKAKIVARASEDKWEPVDEEIEYYGVGAYWPDIRRVEAMR